MTNDWVIVNVELENMWKEAVVYLRCYSNICLKELSKITDSLIQIVDVWAEIRTRDLPNRK